MPSCDIWVKEYSEDPELSAIVRFIQNPGTLSQRSLDAANLDPNYRQVLRQSCPGTLSQRSLDATNLDPNYCQALQQSCLHQDDEILYYHEPIAGSESYTKLQVVPKKFRNIVFIPFHSNPLGFI
jgi:hypothetical protein